MSVCIFDVFSKMITNIPAQAIIKSLDLECKMLEDDLKHSRLRLEEDALSILIFCEFVHLAKRGRAMRCTESLPPNHIKFYKETLVRLIQAKELPQVAMDQFDYTFITFV